MKRKSGIRQAEVIPFCPECKTSFQVHCEHSPKKNLGTIDKPDTPSP